MVQTPTKTLTVAEFLQLPETEPASEYINGQIIQKPMPQGKHSTIQGELVTVINGVLKPQRIAWAIPRTRMYLWWTFHCPGYCCFYLESHSLR